MGIALLKLEDFLLWKGRGFSDPDAQTSVEDRFDDGYVTWKDGCPQYILDDDSEYG